MLSWFGDLFGGLWEGATGFFGGMFAPLFNIVAAFGYLIAKVVHLAYLLVQLFLLLVQVVLSVAGGVISTLANMLTFDPAAVQPASKVYQGYTTGIDVIIDAANGAGANVFAQIISWSLWIGAAWYIITVFAGAKEA